MLGIFTGLAAVLFKFLIKFFSQLFFQHLYNAVLFLSSYAIVLLPATGGLIIGIAKKILVGDFKNVSVSGVIAGLAEGKNFIPPEVVWWQLLAASITMGSGGSVGPEGPAILMGCAIGSVFANRIRCSPQKRQSLIAAGAAGGIAASFNAPLAGAIFAQEVILGDFRRKSFLACALSSVTATYIAHLFYTTEPVFDLPSNLSLQFSHLYLFPILGILAGIYGAFFIRFFHYVGQLWHGRCPIQSWLKPAAGGIAVGIIGLFLPEALGEGHEVMQLALLGGLSTLTLFVLTLGKAVTTSLSLGSGAVGGIFAPTLFLGIMLGGVFGAGIKIATGADLVGGFAVVGMAAVFAAVFKAPVTAILMTFELTRNYHLIMPVILTSIIATYVSAVIETESIYTFKLAKMGMDLRHYHPYLGKVHSG